MIMRDTQRKGDIAVSRAIATFTKAGFDVSLPITESAAYDLIIDTNEGLKRVQVRFTSTGEVDLRRIHSNSKGYVIKKTKPNSYDWLYILTAQDKEYLLKECLTRRSFKPNSNHILDKIFTTSNLLLNLKNPPLYDKNNFGGVG